MPILPVCLLAGADEEVYQGSEDGHAQFSRSRHFQEPRIRDILVAMGTQKTVLAINASPRSNGAVARLVAAAADGATASGMSVERADLYDSNIALCRACMKCRPDGECVLPEDDGHRLGRRIREADGLIIGTPTHWANMSAQLKALLDRNATVFIGEAENGFPVPLLKGKPVVMVAACTTPWPLSLLLDESRGALRAVRHVFKYGGCRVVGSVVFPGSKGREVREKLLARARLLGARLA